MAVREKAVKRTAIISDDFDKRLPGKTVERVGYGGQFFWMVFTDGSFVFLNAYSHVMHYDSEISDYWKAEIGLIPKEEYQRIRDEQERGINERQEKREREALAELLKKYPDAAAAR